MHCFVELNSLKLSNVTMFQHFQILCQDVYFLLMLSNPSDVTLTKRKHLISSKIVEVVCCVSQLTTLFRRDLDTCITLFCNSNDLRYIMLSKFQTENLEGRFEL